MPVIDVHGGTAEREWRAWAGLRTLPAFELPAGGRVVVIAPHPDDETLGVGGTLCTARRRGCTIEIVALTDGEASHAETPELSREALGTLRSRERLSALAALELADAKVIRLGLADGQLAQAHDLATQLGLLVRGARWCFAPLRFDAHPDHDAAGCAAALACEAHGVALAEYPVWAWNWARPGSDELPWARARQVPLDASAQRAKEAAIHAYRSQIEPLPAAHAASAPLPAAVLAYFRRDFEVLFV